MKIESVATSTAPKTDKVPPRLKEATQDFEAFFLTQIFKEMRKTLPEGGLFEQGPQEKLMLEMLDEKMSHQLAHEGSGIGLAKVLMHQLQQSGQA